MKQIRAATVLTILVLSLGPSRGVATAQQLPGNGTLQGTYFFRYLGVNTATGNTATSALGTLTFDGSGKYQVTGTQITHTGQGSDASVSLTASGTYSVLSSGMLSMSSPFSKATLFGAIGTDPIVVGSSSDSPICDLFVALPAGKGLSAATLTGNYYVAAIEIQNGDFAAIRNAFFSITGDGRGGLGNVTINGTAANLGNKATTQISPGATYSVGAAGDGTLTLPAPSGVAASSQLLAGAKTLYVSADGNFFLAGGASAYDMVIGIKAPSSTLGAHPLDGLYFTGLLQDDTMPKGSGIHASHGVANQIGATGTELAYERQFRARWLLRSHVHR